MKIMIRALQLIITIFLVSFISPIVSAKEISSKYLDNTDWVLKVDCDSDSISAYDLEFNFRVKNNKIRMKGTWEKNDGKGGNTNAYGKFFPKSGAMELEQSDGDWKFNGKFYSKDGVSQFKGEFSHHPLNCKAIYGHIKGKSRDLFSEYAEEKAAAAAVHLKLTERKRKAVVSALRQKLSEAERKIDEASQREALAETKRKQAIASIGRKLAEAKNRTKKANQSKALAETRRKSLIADLQRELGEARRKVAEERRRRTAAESKSKASEEAMKLLIAKAKTQVIQVKRRLEAAVRRSIEAVRAKRKIEKKAHRQIVEVNKKANEEAKRIESAQADIKANEEERRRLLAEANREIAEANRKVDEEKRRRVLAEADIKANEEERRRLLAEANREIAEANRKADEEKRRRVLAEADIKANEEERRRLLAEANREIAEANRKVDEEKRRRVLAEADIKANEEGRRRLLAEANRKVAQASRKFAKKEVRRILAEKLEKKVARKMEWQSKGVPIKELIEVEKLKGFGKRIVIWLKGTDVIKLKGESNRLGQVTSLTVLAGCQYEYDEIWNLTESKVPFKAFEIISNRVSLFGNRGRKVKFNVDRSPHPRRFLNVELPFKQRNKFIAAEMTHNRYKNGRIRTELTEEELEFFKNNFGCRSQIIGLRGSFKKATAGAVDGAVIEKPVLMLFLKKEKAGNEAERIKVEFD